MSRNVLYTTVIQGITFDITESLAASEAFWLTWDDDGSNTTLDNAPTDQRYTPEEFHVLMFTQFNAAIARFFSLRDTPVDEIPEFNGDWEAETIWRVKNRSSTVGGQLTVNT